MESHLLNSQLSPENPTTHLQVRTLFDSLQVPPFRHGVVEHRLTGCGEHKHNVIIALVKHNAWCIAWHENSIRICTYITTFPHATSACRFINTELHHTDWYA